MKECDPGEVHDSSICGSRTSKSNITLSLMENLYRNRFDPCRSWVFVLIGGHQGLVVQVDLTKFIEARVEGPQILERFGNLEDLVTYVIRPDRSTTVAESAISEALSKDPKEWDFIVDAVEKGIVCHSELSKAGQPALSPCEVGCSGALSRDVTGCRC